jgi:hypothetical protein
MRWIADGGDIEPPIGRFSHQRTHSRPTFDIALLSRNRPLLNDHEPLKPLAQALSI